VPDAPEVEEGVRVGVAAQEVPEEGRAGGEDDLVRTQLVLLARQGHVEEVLVLAKLTEGNRDVALEVVPTETKLLRGRHGENKSLVLPTITL